MTTACLARAIPARQGRLRVIQGRGKSRCFMRADERTRTTDLLITSDDSGVAECCTVMCSRWCQSGVKYHPRIHVTLSSTSSSLECKSGKVCLMRLTSDPPRPGPIKTSTGGTLEGQAKGAPLVSLIALAIVRPVS